MERMRSMSSQVGLIPRIGRGGIAACLAFQFVPVGANTVDIAPRPLALGQPLGSEAKR